ncbi:MAG: acyl-CoA thioesterase II [Rhodobacteraceae bacterium]|nr:acyl-CoA thioesterase II [Paracoccaceae bacterium]
MTTAIDTLLHILDLEQLEQNLFRGHSIDSVLKRIYGGQVIAQALKAAMGTVEEDRGVHSLHCYFLRPGDPTIPVIYDVERIRDGGSFTTRRVVAIQHGRPIFSMSASFHIHEESFDHQVDRPDVTMPEDLPSEEALKSKYLSTAPSHIKRYWQRERPIEIRPVDLHAFMVDDKRQPYQSAWIKTYSPLPDDRNTHECILAYASDLVLLQTALLPHATSVFSDEVQAASLDHSIWFHRPFRADDWLLYEIDSPSASGARGFSRGSFYNREGQLVASTAQEGLLRRVSKDRGDGTLNPRGVR